MNNKIIKIKQKIRIVKPWPHAALRGRRSTRTQLSVDQTRSPSQNYQTPLVCSFHWTNAFLMRSEKWRDIDDFFLFSFFLSHTRDRMKLAIFQSELRKTLFQGSNQAPIVSIKWCVNNHLQGVGKAE